MAELFYTVTVIIHSCSQVSYCLEYNQDLDLREWKSNEKFLGGHKLKVVKKEKICRVDPTKEQTKEIIRCTMSWGEGKRKVTFLKCIWSPRLVKVLEWNNELWEWDLWWKLLLPLKCIYNSNLILYSNKQLHGEYFHQFMVSVLPSSFSSLSNPAL